MRERRNAVGVEPAGGTPAEVRARFDAELAKRAKVVKTAKSAPDWNFATERA